jgi:CheY-like chemotaxis protein
MGGTTGAAPRSGGGSEFWIELLNGDGTHFDTPTVMLDTPLDVFGHLSVLVVDDDPVNQLLASLQLKALNTTVTTASSGEEAWELMQTHTFDVALVDVQMPPGMSGLELVRKVRSGITHPPLLAVMTASATLADRQEAAEAGADEYVAKPATASDIAAVLRQRA